MPGYQAIMFMTYFSETIHLLIGTVSVALLIGSYMLSLFKKACPLKLQHHYYEIGIGMITWITYLLLAQILTGSLLVWLKHYPLNTPWIRDAYILVSICLTLLLYIRYRLTQHGTGLSIHLCFFSTFIGLILVIHDAVTRVGWL